MCHLKRPETLEDAEEEEQPMRENSVKGHRSKTLNGIKQELYQIVLAHYLVRALMLWASCVKI